MTHLPATPRKANVQTNDAAMDKAVVSSVPASMYSMAHFEAVGALAARMADSKLYGNITREQAFVILQAGMDMGLTPTAAMRGIHVIQGKMAIGSQLMVAQVQEAGHQFEIVKSEDNMAIVELTRRDTGKKHRVKFTVEDARRAGLVGKDNYRNWPRQMMLSRAISECIRYAAPECLNGMVYTPEDFGVTAVGGTLVGTPADTHASDNGWRDDVEPLFERMRTAFTSAGVEDRFAAEESKWRVRLADEEFTAMRRFTSYVESAEMRAAEILAAAKPKQDEPAADQDQQGLGLDEPPPLVAEFGHNIRQSIEQAWADIEATMYARGHDEVVTRKVLKDLRKKWAAPLSDEEILESQMAWLAERARGEK
jgi:hypothetical protein